MDQHFYNAFPATRHNCKYIYIYILKPLQKYSCEKGKVCFCVSSIRFATPLYRNNKEKNSAWSKNKINWRNNNIKKHKQQLYNLLKEQKQKFYKKKTSLQNHLEIFLEETMFLDDLKTIIHFDLTVQLVKTKLNIILQSCGFILKYEYI